MRPENRVPILAASLAPFALLFLPVQQDFPFVPVDGRHRSNLNVSMEAFMAVLLSGNPTIWMDTWGIMEWRES